MSTLSKFFDNKKSIPITRSQERILAPFFNFQSDFDNLFQDFYRALPQSKMEFVDLTISPAMDIVENDTHYEVEIEMAGVDEKDIKVSINNNILTIKASKEVSRKDEKKNYTMREISYGSYERSLSLPDNIDIDKVESIFKKGMLCVNLPKKTTDSNKTKQVEVKKASA